MKLTKLLVFCFSLFSLIGYSQEITVSGKVNDEAGMPIPGASVVIKGTTNGTTTDLDGNYQIKANSGSTLVFSFVGYTSIEQVVKGSSITVKMMPETQNLNEVVVVGYGTQKKSVVTGAITGVKAKDLENQPVVRVEQSLQGRVSGVTVFQNSGQPGASATVRVRGITSINEAANNPLYVVDGQVIDTGGIGYLNQADIESIEVLKDAASSAIYGTRAAAGVVLITTKKGKSGKIAVNYNGYAGFSSPARTLDLLNATQYATLRNEAAVNSGEAAPFADPTVFGKGTNWQDAIFNDHAYRQNHNISVSGGNDVSTFFMSFGINEQDGIVTTDISKYFRKNFRLNSTHKVNRYLTIGQNASYTNEKTFGELPTNTEFGGPLSSAINLDPITPIVVTDPNVIATDPNYANANVIRDPNGNPYGISNYVGQEMTNPVAFTKTKLGNQSWADNFVGNVYAEVSPIEGLKFRSNIGGKLAFYGYNSFTPVYFLSSTQQNSINNITQQINRGFGWNIENTIDYKKSIKNHNFDILLGQGAYVENISKGEGVTKSGINATSYLDASISADVPAAQVTAYAYQGTKHIVTSIFARLNYDYKEKYIATGIIRRDGSSRFGSNNKYGNFPSFSLGWVPTKESFWPENKILTTLKFRGGYGVNGNDQLPDFSYLSTIGGGRSYTFGNSATSVVSGFSPNAPSNPDLRWEETTQTNIGLDATLFQNLTVSFDIYNKQTNGILQTFPIPAYVGSTGSPYGNVGNMSNSGIDMEVAYRKQVGDFNIGLSGQLATLKNRVNYIAPQVPYLTGPGIQSLNFPGGLTRSEPGHSYYEFYGLKTMGVFQNQSQIDAHTNSAGTVVQPNAVPGDLIFKDSNDDGVIDDKDRVYLGSFLPKMTFGFNINLAYKGFDLSVFGQGAAGNKIYQGLRRLEIGTANYQSVALGRWTGEGTSNSYPRLTTPAGDTNHNFTNQSDFFLQDGDYLRLKTVQIGYSLPSSVIGKAGLQKARIYIMGENVATFTKYTGFDPEIGGNVGGIDRGYYPQAKTYFLGVNLSF